MNEEVHSPIPVALEPGNMFLVLLTFTEASFTRCTIALMACTLNWGLLAALAGGENAARMQAATLYSKFCFTEPYFEYMGYRECS